MQIINKAINICRTGILLGLLLLLSCSSYASENLNAKLESIAKLTPENAADQFYKLTEKYIVNAPIDEVKKNENILIEALYQSKIPNKISLIYEIQAHSAKHLLLLNDAKFYAQKGMDEPNIPENLLIRYLSFLAFIETDLENYVVAIENYQIVQRLLLRKKGSEEKLALNYLGLSDFYLKTNLNREAIKSLGNAIKIAEEEDMTNTLHKCYKSMAISYYYLKKPDSLQYYASKAFSNQYNFNDDSVSYHRLNYMKLLLKNDSTSINEIRKVLNSPKDDDKLMTGLHYAEALVTFDKPESAKNFILEMLAAGDLKNLTFLSSQLYKLLSDIYFREGENDQAMVYYKKNVELLTLYSENQYKSNNILTILKYHDIKNRYLNVEHDLEVRKNYFILFSIIALSGILVLFFLYRIVLVKKRFNKLAFDKLNNEISLINSHEVRKHLSNILGIISVIQTSDDKPTTYLEAENALLHSAEELDFSIKNISGKLSEFGN